MRSVLKELIEILDGTPAVYGKQNRWRGQSVVELTLISPLLIVLLMGLAEIGWLANNYLILLEVSRVGARLGTVQTGEMSPLEWNNQVSRLSGSAAGTGWGDTLTEVNGRPIEHYRDCDEVRDNVELVGFYNFIACIMVQQMDPLVFNPPNNDTDDIVISAFSLMAVDPDNIRRYANPFSTDGTTPYSLVKRSTIPSLGDLPQVLVVGRYPTNANECTVNGAGAVTSFERDPFDYFLNSKQDYYQPPVTVADPDPQPVLFELEGYDPPTYVPYTVAPPATAPTAKPERQRGWVLLGNHFINEVRDPATSVSGCIGSEWSIAEVQQLMNGFSFSLRTDQKDQRARLPTQGMVMVELFWQHPLLLKNPVFNPVWTILGDETTLSVWAAFPLPTTEPRIKLLCNTANVACQ